MKTVLKTPYSPLGSNGMFALNVVVRCIVLIIGGLLTSASLAANLNEDDLVAELVGNDSFVEVGSSSYQFERASHINNASPLSAQSIESFHARLLAGKPSRLVDEQRTNWIPIAGSITIFIPQYETHYPLAKRVGDGFVQARIIRGQMYSQLGRHLISASYPSEAQQIEQLYDNAFALASAEGFNKKFGEKLTAQDINLSGLDVIWPEVHQIQGEDVLVPVLHLSSATLTDQQVVGHRVEFAGSAAMFRNIQIDSGSITTRRNSLLLAKQQLSVGEGASITTTGDLNLFAGGTLFNYGSLNAGQAINITAGNYLQKTMVHRFKTRYGLQNRLGKISQINVGDSLLIETGGDIAVLGANVNAGANVEFRADGNILVGTVPLANGSELITRNGERQKSSIEHVISSISAGDSIHLIAKGNIVIDAANLHADRGHIELLGAMGVEILDAQNQQQSHYSAKWRKRSVEESAYVTVAMRAVLDAGKGIRINTDVGEITLRAADIRSQEGTALSTSEGKINLLMASVHNEYNYQSVSENLIRTKTTTRGHKEITGIPNSIVGGLAVEGVSSLNVEYSGDANSSLTEQLEAFEAMPGMEWVGELQRNESLAIDWNLVEDQYNSWNRTQRALSPAAVAIISIAVAAAVGPGAGELFASIAPSTAAGAAGAAATAGMTSLAVQSSLIVTNAVMNGETDLYEIQKDIFSEETVVNVATSMVTAAALSYLDAAFFEEVDVDELAQQQGVPVDQLDTGWLRNAQGQLNLAGQATQISAEAATRATIQVLAKGDSLSQFGSDFQSYFEDNLVSVSVNRLGDAAHSAIADAHFDTAMEYITLAGAGCMLGALGGTDSQDGTNCYSGAGGAVIGKFVGDRMADEVTPEQTDALKASQKEWLERNGILSLEDYADLQNSNPEEYLRLVRRFDNDRFAPIRTLQRNGVNIARLSAGLVALIAEGNVDLAADQANLSFSNHPAMAQRYNVLASINLLEDYQAFLPLIELQEQLAQAANNGETTKAVEQFMLRHPEILGDTDATPAEALAQLQSIVSNSEYASDFSDLMTANIGNLDLGLTNEGLISNTPIPYYPDDASYWALKVASLELTPTVMDGINTNVDEYLAIKFGESCGNVGACVEASTLIKNLLILSDVDDLQSEAQQFFDKNRPLVEATGDPELLKAFDATFAYFSSATEVVVEFGGSYLSVVEDASAALFVMSGMVAYTVTDGAHGGFEHKVGLETAWNAYETTEHIAQNYDTLPGAARDLWDDYSARIDEAEAAGDTFTAEKLRSKRYMVVGASILMPGSLSKNANLNKWKLIADRHREISVDDIPGVGPTPGQGGFADWFNNLSTDEFSAYWTNPQTKAKIERLLRQPGGFHEWLMVSHADKFHSLGVSAQEIWSFRTVTRNLQWINPHTGLPGTHGGHGSGAFHHELSQLINNSRNLGELRSGLINLSHRWNTPNLPAFIKR